MSIKETEPSNGILKFVKRRPVASRKGLGTPAPRGRVRVCRAVSLWSATIFLGSVESPPSL
jgi:hypothetical protein